MGAQKLHSFIFTDRYVIRVMPTGLPIRSPSIIPNGTGFDKDLKRIVKGIEKVCKDFIRIGRS